MALTTNFMGLRVWNGQLDDYNHEQLADNWAKVDNHDHTPGRGVQLTTESLANNSLIYQHFTTGATGLAAGTFMANTSTQTLTAATPHVIEFTVKEFDVSSWFDIVTHKGRYTPQVAGYYRFTANLLSETNESGTLQTIFYKNGSPLLYGGISSSQAIFTSQLSGIVHLNGTTDYLEIWGLCATHNLVLQGAKCFFCGELIGLG